MEGYRAERPDKGLKVWMRLGRAEAKTKPGAMGEKQKQ